MSDDQPTRPFDEQPDPAGDAPTKRFEPVAGADDPTVVIPADAPPGQFPPAGLPPVDVPPTGPGGPDGEEPEKSSKGLIITLSIIGAVLLIVVIIIITVLATKANTPVATSSPAASETPSASASPSESPSPSPSVSKTTPPTTPPSTTPTVASFTASSSTVACESDSATPSVAFSWTSTNAATASFAIDNEATPTYQNLPPNGDTSAFAPPLTFDCSKTSHVYTINVIGGGVTASKSITVTRQ